jgi:hypothetical protein
VKRRTAQKQLSSLSITAKYFAWIMGESTNMDYECSECGELQSHKLHHEVPNPMTRDEVHFDGCNYEASYEGEERGWVPSMHCHEFEAGCYCADSGRCEVCVEKAVDFADYMRDAAKEG